MDDELREAGLMGCGGCLATLIGAIIILAAFTFACVVVIDAIKS
jgi:hypothetical protein